MAGENAYKEFDSASVASASTFKGTISLGKYSLRKRELLLAVIALVALFVVLILAIVLAVEASNSKSDDNEDMITPSSSKQTGGTQNDVDYCHTPECLQAATYQKPIMNGDLDPCTDFYSYACGHYKYHHEQTPLMNDVTAIQEVLDLNQRRLAYLTLYPIEKNQPNSYEKKFQEFMSSCNSHFDKMELGGKPMIEHIIEPMGGWHVFHDDNVLKSFSLQKSLEDVHIKYWIDAFFTTAVKTNVNNWNNMIVELDYGGLGLAYFFYGDNEDLEPIHTYYKGYMIKIANLLCRDKPMTAFKDTIKQFSEDAFEVENKIAKILYNSPALRNPHHPDNLMTLAELNDHMNGSLDFVHYMKTLFNEYPSKFDENTKIAVARLGYFDQLGKILTEYSATEGGKRKLHNYLMWRVINAYVNDLSWEYVHASRKLDHVLYGYKDDSSGFNRCFANSVFNFPDVINTLFVKHFVKDAGKEEADQMMQNIKDVLLQGIEDMPWMSRANKYYAMKKIRESIYKISFPKTLMADDYLNNRYALAEVKLEDYFGSVISLHRMKRNLYNRAIGQPSTRTEWRYHVFEPVITYYNPWHELIITSAFLDNPLFSHKGPKYYNYGGVGSKIAMSLIHAIDEIGASYKEDGSHFQNWWTDTTKREYAKIRTCAIDSQKDAIIGPFMATTGQMVPINASIFADIWTPTLLADASGARLSYMAYKDLMKKDGMEKLPPGFQGFTNDQMFFVSFAQSFCQNTPDSLKYNQLLRGRYPGKSRVNLALRQVPEFQKAFKCPAIPNQCLLFNL